jgi:hypothetical protein
MSKHLRPYIVLLTIAALGSWAGAALAQEEVRATAKPAPTAATPRTIPLGAVHQVPAGQATVNVPLSDEEKALLAIQEEGRQQVLELMRAIDGMPDGPARVAMEKKVLQVKQDNWVKLMRTKVGFARARGDFKSAQEGEMVIENILHPRPIPSAAVARPAPEKTPDK